MIMMQKKKFGLDSFFLHILAMGLMLCDHLWATLFPKQEWMTYIGRIAFPIFAFMIVEGYFHTSNVRTYIRRMFVFAVISEIPFDLVYGSSVFYPFHQNVLWTFLISLISIQLCEKAKTLKWRWITGSVFLLVLAFDYMIGNLAMVDYFGAGVLTVMTFYLFRKRNWQSLAGQIFCLGFLNIRMLGSYFSSITIAGYEVEIVQQGFALFALIPIWFYNGKQGYHSKWFQYICYGFSPGHLLILYLIWQWMMV